MITVYKKESDIPAEIELVILNDVYFNKNTVELLDERAERIMRDIDGASMIGKYRILSRFHDVSLDIDHLSTGCKTVLNVMYNPDKVFCMKECGENALDILYSLEDGQVYSDFPTMSFNMNKVKAVCQGKYTMIDDYEKLKEWWNYA